MPEVGKRCPDCGETKAVSEFGRNKRMADGLARYCKPCFRVRDARSYRKRKTEQGKVVRERVAAPEGHKFCPRCQEIKSHAEFGRNRSQKDGLADYCKPCHTQAMREIKIKNYGSERNYHLKRRYGITEDDYERMLARQGGLCAICQVVPGTHVDHCHASGLVRGVLCFNCNNALGHFQDDVVLMEVAAHYLDGVVLWPDFVIPPERGSGPVAPTRTYHLSRRYGMRHEDVERMIGDQHGLCAVCWDRPPEHVDHCHRPGAVRFALCLPCNTGIGQFRDDATVVWRAVAYLEATFVEWELDEDELEELARLEDARWSEFLSRAVPV
ncbi:endonuclease domain-containing protein [Nonomuraea sp. NPDC003804]|uniref:endonuclease domain-containing protein n=1 Tax=Nonomuraea sp. NPDC003804 TaxID=3154547 RepID=UPI0033A5CD2F